MQLFCLCLGIFAVPQVDDTYCMCIPGYEIAPRAPLAETQINLI